MQKIIIGLVGEKLAGKDETAKYLAKQYGAEHFRFSFLLDQILEMLNLPVSRRNEIDLGLGLRKIFGGSVLAPAIIKKANESQAKLIVINGIRMDEFRDIKRAGAKMLYITAPAETRFQRYQNRHEKTDDALMNYQEFIQQEQEATEIDIPKLGLQADFRIGNIGSLDELYQKLDLVMAKLTTVNSQL